MIVGERAAAVALDANFAELLAWYASWPGGEVHRDADVWRCHAGVAFRAVNAACRVRLASGTADARIADVTHWFAERGLPWRWLVGASSLPADLDGRLTAAGLTQISDNPGMALDLDAFVDIRPLPTGATIERVVDEPGLLRWRAVQRLGLELDETRDHAWWIAHRRPGFGSDAPLMNWVASVDGRPVAAAALFDGAGVAGIYNVVTVPDVRGRGFGRAVTAEAIAEGRRRGLRTAVLGSSDMGYPVYRSLGFRDVSRLRSYTLPATVGARVSQPQPPA
jgi:ribosomal protein S18 acetylase RimI-like enzyme